MLIKGWNRFNRPHLPAGKSGITLFQLVPIAIGTDKINANHPEVLGLES